jgi:hypothetical protein
VCARSIASPRRISTSDGGTTTPSVSPADHATLRSGACRSPRAWLHGGRASRRSRRPSRPSGEKDAEREPASGGPQRVGARPGWRRGRHFREGKAIEQRAHQDVEGSACRVVFEARPGASRAP